MTNKRKSMNTVVDVHAISTEGAQPQIYLRSKGFRDAALTSLGVWDPTGIACGANQQLLIIFQERLLVLVLVFSKSLKRGF